VNRTFAYSGLKEPLLPWRPNTGSADISAIRARALFQRPETAVTYLDVLDQERLLFQVELSWPRPPAISSRPWSKCTRRWAVDGDCALERWHDRLARTVLPAR
jgi:hypothetical protein